ncbi:MAG: hypothetical protein ACI4IH_01605 [Eubacterium sp.]
MKKTVSLILSAVMLICSVFCVNLSALADYDNILALDFPSTVSIKEEDYSGVTFQFTPKRTGTYIFSSHIDSDEIFNPYCIINDSAGNVLYNYFDDETPNANAINVTIELNEGQTYYFRCLAMNVPAEYSVIISYYNSILVQDILLEKDEVTYNQNEQGTLTASVSPGNATNARVNAQTEETDIITSISVGEPSEDGKSKITFNTGSKAGKATVTVSSVETSAVKNTCTVYVKEATPSIIIDSENEALNGFVIGEKYKIYGSEIESVEFTAEAESIAIDESWYGKTVSIVKLNDEPKCNSNAQGLQISAPQPAEPPAKVTGLATTARGANGVNLTISWNAVDGATGYNVYGYNKPADSWTLLDTVTTNKYISPTTPGYEYYFRVAAVNGDVEGTPSDALHTCAACETMDAPSVIASNDKTIQVDWNLVGSHGYVVMWSKDASFKTGVSSKYITGHSKSNYTISVPSGASQYYVRVRAWRNWETGYVYGSWSEGVKAGQTIAKVTGLKTSARGANGVNLTISWNAQAAADSYNVYGYNKANDSWTLLGNVTTNKYISPTTPGYEYIYRVAAVEDGREGVPSERLHTCAACETMKAPTVQKNGSQIKVNWEIVGSHGYVVMWSTDPTFKTGVSSKYITGHSVNNYTITGINSNQTYYVRVRAWRNWDTGYVYGSWSTGTATK